MTVVVWWGNVTLVCLRASLGILEATEICRKVFFKCLSILCDCLQLLTIWTISHKFFRREPTRHQKQVFGNKLALKSIFQFNLAFWVFLHFYWQQCEVTGVKSKRCVRQIRAQRAANRSIHDDGGGPRDGHRRPLMVGANVANWPLGLAGDPSSIRKHLSCPPNQLNLTQSSPLFIFGIIVTLRPWIAWSGTIKMLLFCVAYNTECCWIHPN